MLPQSQACIGVDKLNSWSNLNGKNERRSYILNDLCSQVFIDFFFEVHGSLKI